MKYTFFSAKTAPYRVLFAVLLVSIICRLVPTSQSHVIPGLGSMYYPLQVRCLLERGALGYSDMPLAFRIEALAARMIILFTNLSVSHSIVLACRLVTTILPSLIVFPMFFLTRSVSGNTMPPAYLAVILALSVLNPSILVLFAIDFDKNAIGMLFVYMAVCFQWKYMAHGKARDLALAVLSVLLTLFTHFGCFSSLFVFLIIFTMVAAILNFRALMTWFRGSEVRGVVVGESLIVLILLPMVVKFYDPQRFAHLVSLFFSPLQLFNHSIFILMIHGTFILDWPNMLYLVVINSFSVFSVITCIRLRKRMKQAEYTFFLSLVLWFVLLSNPFINTAIYNRLLFISLIPMSVIMIFVFHYFGKPVKITVAVILALLLILTVATSGVRKTYISGEEYAELKQVGKRIPNPSSTIILAQHRLEFWVSWTLRMKSGQLSGLKPHEYRNYSQVLYIVQKSNRFNEETPKGAHLIRTGRYFDLYRIR